MRRDVCECGCGDQTKIATRTDARRGDVKGEPLRYLKGHNRRASIAPALGYVVEPTTGCWIWKLGQNRQGYGQTKRDGRKVPAHVALWVDRHGPVPSGLELDHLCTVPACCNPDHMEAVTPTENKRRSRATKLTQRQVTAIKASSNSNRVLAERYDVHPASIARIRRGVQWSDVNAA